MKREALGTAHEWHGATALVCNGRDLRRSPHGVCEIEGCDRGQSVRRRSPSPSEQRESRALEPGSVECDDPSGTSLIETRD